MARLPQPGADDGTWGTILNEFLSQIHDDTGALKSNIITGQHIQDGAVNATKLDSALQAAIANPTPGDNTVAYSKLSTTGTATTGTVLSYNGSSLTWATHAELAGLSGDDHVQYHTDARGDARYYQKQYVDDALATKANASHGHTTSDVSGLTAAFAAIKTPTIVVASVDMPQSVKDRADFVCDGTDDDVQINAAIAMAARGPVNYGTGTEQGLVQLTGGSFKLSNSILMLSGVSLKGMGGLTHVSGTITTATGSGTEKALVKLNDVNVHDTRLEDMWLDRQSNFSGHLVQYMGDGGEGSSDFPSGGWSSHYVQRLNLGLHASGDAINLINCPNVIITDVNISNVNGSGIVAIGCKRLMITRVVCRYLFSTGIVCVESTVNISDCVVNDAYNEAAYVMADCDPCIVTGCVALNSRYGFMIQGQVTGTALTAIGCADAAFRMGGNGLLLQACTAYNTGTGRFPATVHGFQFVSLPNPLTDVQVTGVVRPANITNPVSGDTSGARNFVRISDGSSLVTRG